MPRRKRNPGGQPGNQNARKHGFYSVKLSPQEISQVRGLVDLAGMEPGLALIRVKLDHARRCAPGNRRLPRVALQMLLKRCFLKYGYGARDFAQLKKLVRGILKNAEIPSTDIVGTNQAES